MTVDDAIEFIKRAHHGQVDKNGRPYWMHPVSVMRRLGDDASDVERLAALLHDVLEDTPHSAADLLALGVPVEAVEIVQLLTRPTDMPYLDWIRSLAASGNRSAIRVKAADNEDNLDETRGQIEPRLADRYRRSLEILRPAL